MILFDTHYHPAPEHGSVRNAIEQARSQSVRLLLAAASTSESIILCRDTASENHGVWFAAGLHPQNADSLHMALPIFSEVSLSPKMAAVGEIGLDYYRDTPNRKSQRDVLTFFLDAALSLRKPAVIHCRDLDGRYDAYADCHAALSDFARSGGRFVMHCFAGGTAWLERLLEIGAFIGVSGMVTFKKADNIREITIKTPAGRLLLETDSPYLAPVPKRGGVNWPEYLPFVAAKTADIRGNTLEETATQTTANAISFLGIHPDDWLAS